MALYNLYLLTCLLKNRPVKQKLSCFYSFVAVLQDIFQTVLRAGQNKHMVGHTDLSLVDHFSR